MPLSQLVEIAHKVFDNRESWQEINGKKVTKVLEILSTRVTPPDSKDKDDKRGKERPPLDKDQCAYCREMGHWHRNCPRLKAKREKDAKILLSQD